MALDGGAYVPQPYYAFVEFSVLGKDLILEAGRPQHLISFNHKIGLSRTANWSIQLFDATFNLIEHDLWKIAKSDARPIVKFRYGYSQGLTSPYYYSEITKVIPNWAYSGVTITLEGVHVPGQDQKGVPTIWYKRDRAFVDMKISDIVRKLATENGYVIDEEHFDETEELKLPQDLNSTNPINKIFEQKGMSMEQFIQHCLLPYAVKAGTKMGGYVFYIDHRFEPARIQFYVPEKVPGVGCPGSIKRHYTIRKNKMEEWVDFNYDLNYGPLEAVGAFEESQFSIDPTTGEYVFEKYNPDNQKEFMRIYGNAYRKPLFTDDMNNVRMRPSHSPALLEDERKFFHRCHLIRKFNSNMKANLTIVGDPRDDLLPGEYIYLTNLLPDGTPHYSSGCYRVESIEHNIQGGTYTTSFELTRNAASENPPGSAAQDAGGVGQ